MLPEEDELRVADELPDDELRCFTLEPELEPVLRLPEEEPELTLPLRVLLPETVLEPKRLELPEDVLPLLVPALPRLLELLPTELPEEPALRFVAAEELLMLLPELTLGLVVLDDLVLAVEVPLLPVLRLVLLELDWPPMMLEPALPPPALSVLPDGLEVE